jgi:NTE family protein
MSQNPQTAFVLSGGAGLGAIQVGMLRALYERDIAPDLIVGTSVGAINGSFIASRPQTTETADELGEVWRQIHRGHVFPLNPLTGFLGFFGMKDHLVPEGNLRRLVREHLEFDALEDAAIPLHVIATEVLSGRELRLSSGPAEDAVMASAAIPGVFGPVRWGELELVDGGVSNNTPISHAIELGVETVYVLPTGSACDLPEPPRGALGMLLHAMSLLVMRRLLIEVELLQDQARLVVLPPPCPLQISPIDFGRSDELIETALEGSRAYLDALERDDAPAPLPMSMHGHRGRGGARGLRRGRGSGGVAAVARSSPASAHASRSAR